MRKSGLAVLTSVMAVSTVCIPRRVGMTNPPKIYSGGTYLGELSENRYGSDSTSNRFGRYGSKYSPDSLNNPYGPYGRYSTQPIYVYPSR